MCLFLFCSLTQLTSLALPDAVTSMTNAMYTCNNDRNQCDEDFKSCLDNECLLTGLGNRLPKEELEACQKSADLMYSGTYALGCMSYKEAQRNACLCNGRKITKNEMDELERDEEL